MNDKVLDSLVALCTDICKRNGKKKLIWFADKTKSLNYRPKAGEMVITVHRWFANKSCPGNWLYERLGDVAAKVTANLNGTDTSDKVTQAKEYPETPFMVRVIINDLNYRSEPSMKGMVRGQTGIGVFTIMEVRDGWGRLKSGVGWIWLDNPAYCVIEESVNKTSSTKTVDELAKEVIKGLWGNGADRKTKLTAAGYDYAKVQKRVNELLK